MNEENLRFEDLFRIYCAGFKIARAARALRVVNGDPIVAEKSVAATIAMAIGIQDGERSVDLKTETAFCGELSRLLDAKASAKEAIMKRLAGDRPENPRLSALVLAHPIDGIWVDEGDIYNALWQSVPVEQRAALRLLCKERADEHNATLEQA